MSSTLMPHLCASQREPIRRSEHARGYLRTTNYAIVWPLLSEAGTFGALLKTLLLTAQRRDEVANMTWTEIGTDGTWTIPAERYKTKRSNHVPLSSAALSRHRSPAKERSVAIMYFRPAPRRHSRASVRARLNWIGLYSLKMQKRRKGRSRANPELDPSRLKANGQDLDGPRWRAPGYFGAGPWARHCRR